jgi:hypothetical protein
MVALCLPYDQQLSLYPTNSIEINMKVSKFKDAFIQNLNFRGIVLIVFTLLFMHNICIMFQLARCAPIWKLKQLCYYKLMDKEGSKTIYFSQNLAES